MKILKERHQKPKPTCSLCKLLKICIIAYTDKSKDCGLKKIDKLQRY